MPAEITFAPFLNGEVTAAIVRQQVKTILASRHFVNAERLGRFLCFVAEKTLAGHGAQIKESVIGVEVFDRPTASYDPGIDPIVRVQARRLRAKLREYYEGEGANDLLLIELPRGHYIPSFRMRHGDPVQRSERRQKPPPGAKQASVAVLPFLNMSSDPENDYFSDGLTEELIHALAAIPALHVAARTSTFQFKGKARDVAEIGRVLGVGKIVEGSVRKSGERLRITVQLIDVAGGGHLWSERYDRTITDIFALQEEIASAVRQALSAKLTEGLQAPSARRATENIDAFTHYLQGRFQWNKRSERGLRAAIQHFRNAIDLDAGYARAYSGLADCYLMLGMSGAEAPENSMPLARQAALQALAIDDRLAEAHTSLAAVMANFDWDWPGADREFRRALDLDPSYATLHHWQALFYFAHQARFDEAASAIQRAVTLDPISLPINLDIALIDILRGRYDDAIGQCGKVLDLDSNYDRAHWFIGMARWLQGDFQAAIEALQRARTLGSGGLAFRTRILGALGHTLGGCGRKDEARAILAELQASAKTRYVDPFEVAKVHAGLGETDAALDCLERAAEEQSCHMANLLVWPGLESLRSRPRFETLLARVYRASRPQDQKDLPAPATA